MSKARSIAETMSFLNEYNKPRDLSATDTSPAKMEGDCQEVAGALRAAARTR
ncbi:hypothetical protein ACEN17_09110 [Corynebacterium rouxii]|uniref:hypothetical protein n=1 Tax=Corynebacterium rouxii TaxID=2719119 RepID=UPI003CFA0745